MDSLLILFGSYAVSIFNYPGSLESFENESSPVETRREPCPQPIYFSYLWCDYYLCEWVVIYLFQEASPLQTKPLLILMVSTIFPLLWKQEQNPFPNTAHLLVSTVRSAHPWNKLVDLIQQTFPISNVFLQPLPPSH